MKKIFTILAMLFAVINIMAQEHLSFKGIPIEGSITTFCQKLKTKGFTSIGRDNNITMFTGDFTGRKATVGVTATSTGTAPGLEKCKGDMPMTNRADSGRPR